MSESKKKDESEGNKEKITSANSSDKNTNQTPKIDFSKLSLSSSPHVKRNICIPKIMYLVIASLLPATIYGVYIFGIHALFVILASVLSAILTELIIQTIFKQPNTAFDGSAALTGLLLAMVIPPSVPIYIPILGSIFAICIAKLAFGGLGNNIFNPALAARAFLVVSFPVAMTTWLFPKMDGVTGATPLGLIKQKGVEIGYNTLGDFFHGKANIYVNMFIGNTGGSLGETSAFLLLVGGMFLLVKKIISWRIPVPFIGSVFLLSILFGKDPIISVLSGGVFIGAFFMATDYVTSPTTKKGQIIFGLGCGVLTVLIRELSSYPEGVMFAILLMNCANPLIDRFCIPNSFGQKAAEEKKVKNKDNNNPQNKNEKQKIVDNNKMSNNTKKGVKSERKKSK